MRLVLVDIRARFRVEFPPGPPERGGELPDRVHRASDEQKPGRGAAAAQRELDRVHQEERNRESQQNFTGKPTTPGTN